MKLTEVLNLKELKTYNCTVDYVNGYNECISYIGEYHFDREKLDKSIKEWLMYFVKNIDEKMTIRMPNGNVIQYKGLPAISRDLAQAILDNMPTILVRETK